MLFYKRKHFFPRAHTLQKQTYCAGQVEQRYKSKYKKVGVLLIRIVQSNVSSIVTSSERNRSCCLNRKTRESLQNLFFCKTCKNRNTRESFGELEIMWKHSPCVLLFPLQFLVLPNFHSCFYNCMETHKNFKQKTQTVSCHYTPSHIHAIMNSICMGNLHFDKESYIYVQVLVFYGLLYKTKNRKHLFPCSHMLQKHSWKFGRTRNSEFQLQFPVFLQTHNLQTSRHSILFVHLWRTVQGIFILGAVYMGGGTGRLPGWDVCRDGTLNGISRHVCIYLLFVPFRLFGKNFAGTFFIPSRQSGTIFIIQNSALPERYYADFENFPG